MTEKGEGEPLKMKGLSEKSVVVKGAAREDGNSVRWIMCRQYNHET
jgi:hypothetical protein